MRSAPNPSIISYPCSSSEIHPRWPRVVPYTKTYERNIMLTKSWCSTCRELRAWCMSARTGSTTASISKLQQTIGWMVSQPSVNHVNTALYYHHPAKTQFIPSLLKLYTRCCQMRTTFSNILSGVTSDGALVTSYGGQLKATVWSRCLLLPMHLEFCFCGKFGLHCRWQLKRRHRCVQAAKELVVLLILYL